MDGSSRLRWAALGGVLLALACDGSPKDAAAPVAAPPRAAESSALPAPSELPKAGAASLELRGGRATLLANRAPTQKVLFRLASLVGFSLVLYDEDRLAKTVTGRWVDLSVDDVLAALLAGVPYSTHYELDPFDKSRVLDRVVAGAVPEDPELEVASSKPRKRRVRSPEAIPSREEIEVAYEVHQDLYFPDLAHRDPTVRVSAVESIYLDDRTFPLLNDLLSSDPDPGVRAAAATTLGDDLGNREAANALLGALEDPNPEVVIAALDALEDVGDSSIIVELTPLVAHPNADVRDAAVDAIEWLED